MRGEFKGKWLVRYYPVRIYNKLDIWNLEVIDIPNPISRAYQEEAMNAYNEYEKIKDEYGFGNSVDGKIVIGNDCEWLLTNAGNGIDKVLLIFSERRRERNNGELNA